MISSTVFVIVLCAVLFPVCLLFGIAAYKNNKSKLISNREMGIGLVIGAVLGFVIGRDLPSVLVGMGAGELIGFYIGLKIDPNPAKKTEDEKTE